MKNTIIGIVIICLTLGLAWILQRAVLENDYQRCLELKEQSEKYPSFYLTQNEKDMCDFHKVEIVAPVK